MQTSHSAAVLVSRYVDGLADAGGSLYLAGSPAAGDFSVRSNLDLVAVTPEPLDDDALGRLAGEHRSLVVNGRRPVVAYVTWDDLQKSPSVSTGVVFEGRRRVGRERLVNPMTWAILAQHPVALHGVARPDVCVDEHEVKGWLAAHLRALAGHTGRLLWRPHLTRLVLQATRASHGALTGEVLSLTAAGQLALVEGTPAGHAGHMVLTDAIGYREGANTSMYWGPFERKSNALTLVHGLLDRVQQS